MHRIAVLDDHDSVRNALRRLLSAVGMEVETFASGQELLQAFTHRQPDCLLIDLHLPLTEGADVMDLLRSQGLSVPTVAMAVGDAEIDQSIAEAEALGVICVRKPIDEETLLRAIARAMGADRREMG